jgi:hypothetical protein
MEGGEGVIMAESVLSICLDIETNYFGIAKIPIDIRSTSMTGTNQTPPL